MSHKVYDGHGRWRNKIVSFRVSEEEADELDRAVSISGLSKQDYLINRIQNRDITVTTNPRVYKALLEQMQYVVKELKQALAEQKEIEPELKASIMLMLTTLTLMKGKERSE